MEITKISWKSIPSTCKAASKWNHWRAFAWWSCTYVSADSAEILQYARLQDISRARVLYQSHETLWDEEGILLEKISGHEGTLVSTVGLDEEIVAARDYSRLYVQLGHGKIQCEERRSIVSGRCVLSQIPATIPICCRIFDSYIRVHLLKRSIHYIKNHR